MSGYIKIDRKITEWEWYKNLNTKVVFFHCLLKANWKDGKFEGKIIKRGSFVTSIKKLSLELCLTEDEVRTAIKHLISTGELTKQTTNKYSVITVSNYELYQDVPEQIPINSQTDTKQIPNNSHSIPKQFPTIEERKNIRREEGKKERREEDILTVSNETVCQTDVRRIIDRWNVLSEFGIKPIKKIGSGTKVFERLCARIREYGIDDVLSTIDMIKDSDFLLGRVKDFTITLDWFSRPNNFQKVYNGNYSNGNRKNGYQSQTAQMLDSFYDQTAEWVRKMEQEEQGNEC